jgi:hydroxyethylthiazole kinase
VQEDKIMPEWSKRASELLGKVRDQRPMIHHLTNDVVTNLTANVTLCLGAAPVMAPCEREVEEMVSFAGALLLNIGTLNDELVRSMIRAGEKANELGIPVILDPVGAGATTLRTESALAIMEKVKLTVLRGNAGEVLTLVGAGGKVRGVDSMEEIGERDEAVSAFAKKQDLVVAVTGPVDLVADGVRRLKVKNGHEIMGRVTGTGCSATTAIAAFVAVSREEPLEAAACALSFFGLSAEEAAKEEKGPGTFVPLFLDALARVDDYSLRRRVRIEEVA